MVAVPGESGLSAGPRSIMSRGGSAVADAPTVAAVVTPIQTPEPAQSLAGVAVRPAPEAVPAGVPGYHFTHPLGRGGMGTVYLARQLSLGRPVAIKVMSRKWAADPVFVARFTREAFAAALLNHPNVVQIYDIGEHGGVRYFSMEYVPGRTLAEHLKSEGKLDGETAVGYVLQAARGLEHAHERGMIHRDVKPDNLLLDDQGRVKVADLGLVKTPESAGGLDQPTDTHPRLAAAPANVTGMRIALGTPAYMAPEQCRDAATVDHRADIYSLGCTLYVLVTGRPPFDGTTAVELMTKHAYEPIVPPEMIVGRVPKELSAVILKMLAKDPRDRFQSMGEVIRTLEQWLGVRHAGTFNPRDEQIEQLEGFVERFHAAPSAVLKSRVVAWALGGCFLAATLMLFFRPARAGVRPVRLRNPVGDGLLRPERRARGDVPIPPRAGGAVQPRGVGLRPARLRGRAVLPVAFGVGSALGLGGVRGAGARGGGGGPPGFRPRRRGRARRDSCRLPQVAPAHAAQRPFRG